MFRKILNSAALLALAVATAQAQANVTFKFVSGSNSDYTSYQGQFTNPATSSFQVWCVDEQHYTQSGLTYDAWASNLAGDLSKTRQNSQTKYLQAAWLADHMTTSNNATYQYAIWAIVHGKASECAAWNMGSQTWSGTLSGCNPGDVTNAVSAAGTGASSVNASNWYVITAKSDYQDNQGQWVQEMLAKCDRTPSKSNGEVRIPFCDQPDWPNEEPTPEPATMTLLAIGLAGMAGTSLKRRRN